MALMCPDCGFSNEDSKLFCGACGEPIAGDAKVARDVERMKEKKEKEAEEAKKRAEAAAAAAAAKAKTDDDFVHKPLAKKQDNTDLILLIILLALFFVLCVCIFVGLEYFFKA